MAQKEVIEIEAKTGQAEKDIENLTKEVQNLSKAQEDTAKSTESIASSFGALTKGAIIGVAIKAFEAFTEVLNNNQKVADFFATSLEFVSIAFNDLVNFIIDSTGPITKTFKAIFENPLQSVKDLGEAIKDNLIERFESLIDTVSLLGQGFVKFFSGDFVGAAELAGEASKEFVDVLTGVDNTVDKVVETTTEAVEAVRDYATSTYNAAEANVQLSKAAEIAAVANQGLIEKYDRQAEIQRQIRDDERNSLEDRRKANDELGKILEKQAKEMLANAQIALDAANAELSKNKDNQEAIIAKMEAENELAAIKAQIKGFESEQQANDLALDREEIELIRSKAETEIDAYETVQTARIEAIDNEQEKIRQTAILEEEVFNRRKELLQKQIDQQVKGSTQRAELENEMATLIAENDAKAFERQKTNSETLIELKKKEEETKYNITASALSAAQGLAEEGSATYKALAVAQVVLDTFRGVQAAFSSANANVAATAASFGAYPFIQAAAAAAFGAANVAGILSVDTKNPSGASLPSVPSGPTVGANVSAPSFNIQAAQQQTALLNDISQATQMPARAYVVSKDISSAQELDRNRIKNATI